MEELFMGLLIVVNPVLTSIMAPIVHLQPFAETTKPFSHVKAKAAPPCALSAPKKIFRPKIISD
jgi:hypothetical protein